MENKNNIACPICLKDFSNSEINIHVEKCLFLHSNEGNPNLEGNFQSHRKKVKLEESDPAGQDYLPKNENNSSSSKTMISSVPLAERMRPITLNDFVGQEHILEKDKMLRQLLCKRDIPNMILWGPPGCGKTSLANVISNICKPGGDLRFVKLSATMSGINEVKEVVKIAINDMKYKRKTILFMDEIHRFNKLQQDTFLPHIESGTIILIGATTENPSFSLNSALLSRCRVIVLEKLKVHHILSILLRTLKDNSISVIQGTNHSSFSSSIDMETLQWLAEICDGDARVALNSLHLAIQSMDSNTTHISLENVKDGIKRSHILYDRKGEEHYNLISALHKSVRASDDNAALYWLTRMLESGEDPLYIARRLIRIAGEDIGLGEPSAMSLAVSCMEGCKHIGMPECDVLLAQCVVYLSRAPKSTEVYRALTKCKKAIASHKGPLPGVPIHLRNAPTKLMAQLGYGEGYNTRHKEESGIKYLPEGMENINFFKDD